MGGMVWYGGGGAASKVRTWKDLALAEWMARGWRNKHKRKRAFYAVSSRRCERGWSERGGEEEGGMVWSRR